jgi:tetratricopeptide (TPR) repeat protein/predicted Ser/Thr protein kinase
MTPCPSDLQLGQLLAEELSPDEAGTLARHTDDCPTCQQRLERLLDDPTADRWRQLMQPTSVQDQAVDRGGSTGCVPGAAAAVVTVVSDLSPVSQSRLTPPLPADDAALTAVPGYQVLDELGRGGMGVVYRARQESLNRQVALKVIGAGAQAQAEEVARFHIEAVAVARLQHPHIVQVYETGESQGQPYLVMELVEGSSLAEKLAEAPLEARAAAALVRALATAMQHAHERGVVHRDLKPANVLLSSDGTPKVTDFGLAKRLDVGEGQTRAGQMLGTPSYMAPEQATSQKDTVGPAADVYALGAVLYECLTGRPPFKGATPWKTVLQVLHTDPVPPRRLQPGVPRDLETICLRCLHKEARKRYPSAHELAEDLRRFLAGETILARPAGPIEKATKWARRRPTAAALVLVSVCALVILLAGGVWYNARLRAARDRAEDNFQMALQAVDEMLTEVGEEQLASEPRMEEKRLALLKKALAFSRRFLEQKGEEPGTRLQTALACKRVGDIQRLLGQGAGAREAYSQAIALLEPLRAGEPGKPEYRQALASCHNFVGEVWRTEGGAERAEEAYLQAAALQEQLAADFPGVAAYRQELARTRYNLGILSRRTGRPVPAEELIGQAIDLLSRLVKDEPGMPAHRQHLARAYLNLGPALRALSRPAEAEEAYGQARTLLEALAKEDPEKPDYRQELAVVWNNLGNVRAAGKRLDDAGQAHRQAVALLERLARDFPRIPVYRQELANSTNSLASVLARAGRLKDAAATWEQAVDLLRALHAEHPGAAFYQGDLGMALGNLGWVLSEEKDWAGARPKFEEAIVHLQAALTAVPNNPDYLGALRNQYRSLSETLVRLQEHAAASVAAEKLAATSLQPGESAYFAACFLARCMPLAEQDARLPRQERQVLVRNYGDRALALLREALRKGYRLPDPPDNDPLDLFKPLEDRAECRALLDKLQRKARPGP